MAANQEADRLAGEHVTLLRVHAEVQARCSALLVAQAARIAAMEAQLIVARAATVRAATALAWEREDRAALEAALPGLGRRVALGRQIAVLQARVHDLTHTLHGRDLAGQATRAPTLDEPLPAAWEASVAAADLVICQTGCMSHGDYWRVQDHCKRTGKLCMLVDQPDGLQIVRIHRPGEVLAP
ncbi:DUF2325 domain-containing protein [Massilia aurea]|uniref:DUF2325 domain-containing protein n=1 Tax=Massilia aurea TaxID=373040 RepID=UPI00346294A2